MSVAGRDAFSAEVMFRIMLIQSWYKLSDYQMEEQLSITTCSVVLSFKFGESGSGSFDDLLGEQVFGKGHLSEKLLQEPIIS
ncbi:hypothetical protein MASR1M36_03020 [Candidatus Cloacimonadaceae bacterium]